MKTKQKNIFSTDKILQRKNKEKLLKQKGVVIWLTGLSGSGKTTLAIALEKELFKKGILTQILDGDEVRKKINNDLGFSEKDRTENIRRIAEVAKLFLNCGVITICCFVSPTIAMRSVAKKIIGEGDFVEVFVKCPLKICEQRDVKGLYAKARNGEIKNFTGIDSPFENPKNPGVEIRTDKMGVNECVKKILIKIQ